MLVTESLLLDCYGCGYRMASRDPAKERGYVFFLICPECGARREWTDERVEMVMLALSFEDTGHGWD